MRRQFLFSVVSVGCLTAAFGITLGLVARPGPGFDPAPAFAPSVPPIASILQQPVRLGPDGLPDPVYTIPPGEISPGMVMVMESAGDVADWGHATLGVPEAWKTTKGKGVKVAILDTGCDGDHRDLKDRIVAAKDFTGSRSGWSDVQGHGTHVAGVVVAAENGVGMVGVAPEAQLIVAKVLDDRGSGLSSWIAAGIDWSVDQGADVISMSLGGGAADARTLTAIRRARSKGVIVIAAAGNEGPREGTIGYPGGFPESVCVGAVDDQLRVAGFSSRGRELDVAAPGVNIRSCYPGDRFATMSGTSMATPYVAGAGALYVADKKARNEPVKPEEFHVALKSTSRDLPPPGIDTASGAGLIQPAKLVGPPSNPKPPDPPVPGPGGTWTVTVPPEHAGKPVKSITVEFGGPSIAPPKIPVVPAPPPVLPPLSPFPPELCPGGVCPVPPSPARRAILPWRR